MIQGIIKGICICPAKGEPMQTVKQVKALAGLGLEGDRYTIGAGSFNKDKVGHRQVTLMNAIFFSGSGFTFEDSRRNLFVEGEGVELMWLIGREFQVGTSTFRGLKYCDPCDRPSNKCGKPHLSFKKAFQDRGGLIAEILTDGVISEGGLLIPPPKGY